MNCTAIVLAAGQGKRMKSKIQKQFLLLKGKPVLFYSISCFEKSSEIDDIIIVTGAESVEYVKREIVEPFGFQKVKAVVTGGKNAMILFMKDLRHVKTVIMCLFMMAQDHL